MEQAPLIDSALKVVFCDISLERTVHNLARQNVSATYDLVEIAKAVNRLRQSSGVEYLIPDEVLEHMTRFRHWQAINASTMSS